VLLDNPVQTERKSINDCSLYKGKALKLINSNSTYIYFELNLNLRLNADCF